MKDFTNYTVIKSEKPSNKNEYVYNILYKDKVLYAQWFDHAEFDKNTGVFTAIIRNDNKKYIYYYDLSVEQNDPNALLGIVCSEIKDDVLDKSYFVDEFLNIIGKPYLIIRFADKNKFICSNKYFDKYVITDKYGNELTDTYKCISKENDKFFIVRNENGFFNLLNNNLELVFKDKWYSNITFINDSNYIIDASERYFIDTETGDITLMDKYNVSPDFTIKYGMKKLENQ